MANSIFDLNKTVTFRDADASRAQYIQLPPVRDVTGDQFSAGPITFRWHNSSSTYTIPNKCYIRMRLRMVNQVVAGEPLRLTDDIAPNINMGHHFFSNCEWRINDRMVSRISDYVAQIGALDTRLNRSATWCKTIGAATNYAQVSMSSRKSAICNDGTPEFVRPTRALPVVATYVQATGAFQFASAVARAQVSVRSWLTPSTFYYPMRCDRINPADATQILTTIDRVIPNGFNTWLLIPEPLEEDKNQGASFQEITFQLPMSIWKVQHGIPACNHQLILTPQTKAALERSIIESYYRDHPEVDIQFVVTEMYLMLWQIDGTPVTNTSFVIDLENIRCQTDNNLKLNLTPKTFDVSPSTFALTLAYQDNRVSGGDTRCSAAKFLAYSADITQETTQCLTRFYIQFAGQQYPNPDADPLRDDNFNSVVPSPATIITDFAVERYMQTMINTGLFTTDDPESIGEFRTRGSYFYFPTPRDSTDNSTKVTIHQEFKSQTRLPILNSDMENMRVLLFDHSRQAAKITIAGGHVTNVQLEDV